VTEISAEEKLRLVAFRQEQEAMNAPSVVRGGNGLPSTPNAGPINDALQQFGPLASLLGAGKALVGADGSASGIAPASAKMQAGVITTCRTTKSENKLSLKRLGTRRQ